MAIKILHLTLYKQWFNDIADGTKTVEYRKFNDYWTQRLRNKDGTFKVFDEIHFKNGYQKDAPFMRVKWNTTIGPGWIGIAPGLDEKDRVYSILLGKVIEIKNWRKHDES